MTARLADSIAIVDTDSHVTEPPDLWVSRLPARFRADAPRVERFDGSGLLRWRVGDDWLMNVGFWSYSGWMDYPPDCPPSLEEADPAVFDPKERLRRLDEFGVWAQVLYPN